ncbi:MAG: putative conjugal transfer protein [Syntrophomonadaceae bacterium]|nr:putative conjugal transfer protein [Bacillota bacterium]
MSNIFDKRLGRAGGLTDEAASLAGTELDVATLLRIREKVYQRLDRTLLANRKDHAVMDDIRRRVLDIVSDEMALDNRQFGRLSRAGIADEILKDILGFGPLQDLLDDADVDEVMVNRHDRIYCEKSGVISLTDLKFRDDKHLRDTIERIVSPIGRRIDESSPLVDARLPDGSRVNAVIPPIGLDGAILTIRKFRKGLSVADLVRFGSIDQAGMDMLAECVRNKFNIVISGGTGSGKTSFLNCLSSFIPTNERIITIEDSAELQMQQDHVVRMETRPLNLEGKGDISMQTLVSNALRMRPDRIIVGECRRGEAFDMLQAMNTGHEGSMTTLHANTPQDAVYRMENMVVMSGLNLPLEAIRVQIASTIHLIVQVTRLPGGKRRVTHIATVNGLDKENRVRIVDVYVSEDDKLIRTAAPIEGPLALFLERGKH